MVWIRCRSRARARLSRIFRVTTLGLTAAASLLLALGGPWIMAAFGPEFAESARLLDAPRLGKQRVECIQVVEHMGFCLGNAIKYIWRADEKGNAVEDLKKARWYIDREIARRESA